MRANRLVICAFILCLSLSFFAQAKPAGGTQAPVQSGANPARLRAVFKGNEIQLSWEVPVDAPGGFAVYRSGNEILAATLDKATLLGKAGPTDRSFRDKPPDRDAYYYAVLSLDKAGKHNAQLELGKNSSMRPVGPEPSAEMPVESLKAQVVDDSIRLSFKRFPGSGSLALYRGTGPFSDTASLLEAVLVSTFEDRDGSFVDYPVPGIDYWYALLSESDLKAGKIQFISGANATSRQVQIPPGLYRLGLPAMPPLPRTPPLPAFALAPSISGSAGRKAARLGAETEKAINQLLSAYTKPRASAPVITILPEEKRAPAGGEDYALSLIVQNSLLKGDYSGAVEQLTKYLSLNRGTAADARARFYLAESLARSGSYREAFFEFLRVRAFFGPEVRPWMDYLIYELRRMR